MQHVSTDGVVRFLQLHPRAKVLDVRCAHEREAGGHRQEDFQVPWYTPDWELNPDFLAQVLTGISPDDYVLVICRNGHRSCEAAARLETAGFRHVYNVLGGFEDFQGNQRGSHRSAYPGDFSPT